MSEHIEAKDVLAGFKHAMAGLEFKPALAQRHVKAVTILTVDRLLVAPAAASRLAHGIHLGLL